MLNHPTFAHAIADLTASTKQAAAIFAASGASAQDQQTLIVLWLARRAALAQGAI